MKGHFFHRKDLQDILDNVLNKTLGEIDENHVFDKAQTNPKITGIAGDVIEQSVLGYPADNLQRPDLNVDGVETELKTTGIRLSKKDEKKYEAKEPMSITAVSPNQIVLEQFSTSRFWHKLKHMLLVYYHYSSTKTVKASEYADFYIRGYEFHEFNAADEAILKNDWELIRDFIIEIQHNFDVPESQYSRISSELRDKLAYIDTAPKWPNPPRFRLKRQVVTDIVQKHFGNKKLNQIELFQRLGIVGKSITMTMEGNRTEDTKLFVIDFDEWTDKNILFEESAAYDFFANHQLLCMIFEEPSQAAPLCDNKFLGFKRLIFRDEFIQGEVRKIWEEVRSLIWEGKLTETVSLNKEGEPIVNKKTRTFRTEINFPKSRNNLVFVRGGGVDASVKTEEVNGIKMYKQYVWIKGSYIVGELKKLPLL